MFFLTALPQVNSISVRIIIGSIQVTCMNTRHCSQHVLTQQSLLQTQKVIQGGAEPIDTFQMVTDNIWKQGKISETVYKYVQICYLLPTG